MISFCVVQRYMYTCYSPIQYTKVLIFLCMYVLVRTLALPVGYGKPPPNILSIPCIPYNIPYQWVHIREKVFIMITVCKCRRYFSDQTCEGLS